MKIVLHIERLILDGLPLERRHGREAQAAVAQELTRLLRTHGLGPEWRAGGAAARVTAPGFQWAKETPPRLLGRQIAQSIHGGIGGKR